MPKSWIEKLNDSTDYPKVVTIPKKMEKRLGRGKMVIPSPLCVDALMRKARKGRLLTIDEIRKSIAREHQVTTTCAMVAGIHANIAAKAADELECQGQKRFTAYWRTLKTGGELNPKFPGGIDGLKVRLESEGHQVIQKGKRWFVEDYEKKITKL